MSSSYMDIAAETGEALEDVEDGAAEDGPAFSWHQTQVKTEVKANVGYFNAQIVLCS